MLYKYFSFSCDDLVCRSGEMMAEKIIIDVTTNKYK